MRRSSAIRCLRAVIGETSVTNEKHHPSGPRRRARSQAEKAPNETDAEDGMLLKLPLAA
jgi:hypothetical protein